MLVSELLIIGLISISEIYQVDFSFPQSAFFSSSSLFYWLTNKQCNTNKF